MPGLSNNKDRVKFENSLKKIKHFDWYSIDEVYCDSNIEIAKSCYDGYPFVTFENDNQITLIDGVVFNKSASTLKNELGAIFSQNSFASIKKEIKNFILSAYGEFVILNYDKQLGRLLIFNDALGRLPFYYSFSSNTDFIRFTASREMNFLVSFLENRTLSRLASAEYLLFGFVLGGKTLLKEVNRMCPSTFLAIDLTKNRMTSEQTFTWNLDPENDNSVNVKIKAKELSELFTSSLKDIVTYFSEESTHVVSLSGGLDSRAILGGFNSLGLDPIAYSFSSGEDQTIKKLVAITKTKHHFVTFPCEISFEDHLKLLGLVNLGLRSRVNFLSCLKNQSCKQMVMYTGDGGDKTVAPLKSNSDDLEELINHLIKSDKKFELKEIQSMLNVDITVMRNHLKEHIQKYPEKTMDGKLAHFKIFERGFNGMFLGEDRTRYFFWSTTPFYYLPFFKAAMNIPQKMKANYILYKHFLLNLNPDLCKVKYYNRMLSLTLPDFYIKLYVSLFDRLKEYFYKPGMLNPLDVIRGTRKKHGNMEENEKLRSFAQNCLEQKPYADILKTFAVSELLQKENNPLKIDGITTLVAYLDLLGRL